ncbi:MAG: aspartate kinase, partial [Sphaerochaetaceae bacterium]
RLTDDGRVDEVTYDLAEKRLSHIDGGIVIPGFYGTGPDNNVKTFSRGGSDISGAIAARSIGASKYENWTDVSGIFIADPRIAKNAGPMDHMTYKEIRELATIGASVFHEDAIAPVRSVGVPINVKNTNDPSAKGTMITPTRDTTIDPIVGVSGEKPYRSITVDAFMLKRYPEKLKAIEGALQQHELKVDLTVDAFDTVVYYVRTEIEDDQAKALEETLLKSLDVDSVTISAQRALIGIVGEGIKAEKKLLSSVTNLLNSKGIDFEIVGQLLPVKSLISVPLENYKDALNALVDLIIGA